MIRYSIEVKWRGFWDNLCDNLTRQQAEDLLNEKKIKYPKEEFRIVSYMI